MKSTEITHMRFRWVTHPMLAFLLASSPSDKAEQQIDQAVSRFRDEIAAILSDAIECYEIEGHDVSALCTDSRKPLISVKISLTEEYK